MSGAPTEDFTKINSYGEVLLPIDRLEKALNLVGGKTASDLPVDLQQELHEAFQAVGDNRPLEEIIAEEINHVSDGMNAA